MGQYKVLIQLMPDTALVADASVNTWWFDVPANDDASFTAIRDALDVFYTAIAADLSPNVAPANTRFKMYNMAHSEPRVPVRDEVINIGTTGTTALPAELAIVLSYRAELESGINPARLKGRVFLGPLWDGTVFVSTGRITPTTQDRIRDAAQVLLDTAQAADPNWFWMQHSTTSDTFNEVVAGWVDDVFDVQRRRGLASSSKLTFA